MNPRFISFAALLVAIAACAYFFLSSEPKLNPLTSGIEPPQPDRALAAETEVSAKNAPKAGNPALSAGKKPPVDWKLFAAMMGASGESNPRLPEPTAEEVARFLAKRGETPANLVAAFEKTHDRRLLERGLELFPSSPFVLMAAIEAVPQTEAKPGEKAGPDAERMALIGRFKTADPNNPLPWIFSAQELFKAGAKTEAVADIRAALERPAFYIYANERIDSAQRLYEDIGLGAVEAGAVAMFGLTLPHMSAANQSSRMLMEWQKSAVESGDAAAANEALRLTYSLGRTFTTPEASRTLIGQLVGISMEKRALEALPAGSQPDWLKVTPAERLAEIEQKKADARGVASGIESVLRSQDSELITEYLRRMRIESEAAAYQWLKKQRR